MADGAVAGQPPGQVGGREVLADEAAVSLRREAPGVQAGDAAALLTAVLQRMEAQRDDGGGVVRAENSEHPALFVQTVVRVVDVAHRAQACDPIAARRTWARREPQVLDIAGHSFRAEAVRGRVGPLDTRSGAIRLLRFCHRSAAAEAQPSPSMGGRGVVETRAFSSASAWMA